MLLVSEQVTQLPASVRWKCMDLQHDKSKALYKISTTRQAIAGLLRSYIFVASSQLIHCYSGLKSF
jgi:hypothetical protein